MTFRTGLFRFSPGQIMATPGVIEPFNTSGERPLDYLYRHLQGDWGDLSREDRQANEDALKHGNRILSAYVLKDGVRVWLITEWDRSLTTFLLPEEY